MQTPDDPSRRRLAARNRFLAACSLAGAATTAYRSPRAEATDEPCWIDIARLGSPDAPSVLVLSCGLNGAEGYCGSTIVTEWLAQGRQRDIPRDVSLVMLHTLMPTNFAAGSAPVPEKEPHRSWSDNALSAAARRFASYAETTGLKTATDKAPGGLPKSDTTWMAAASDAIVDELIEHARRIAVIEFHTSLRPYGEVAIASCHPAGDNASQRLKSWYGEEAETGDPAILDLFALGFGDRLTDLTLTAAHVEFGVYTMRGILQLDARHGATERREDVRSLFSPVSQEWRDHISKQGIRIIGRALEGLATS
jgi:hypothetical protein